jgi:RHS repeat-associated protein
MKEKSNNNASAQFLKTDGGKTRSNAIEVPSIALPKGGGAIKGIDEKFSVNAVNATASFAIELPISKSSALAPELSLSYNSGAGNGVCGLGWNIALESIKRKTEQGLPQYLDGIESDTFILSGAEDLIPEFKKSLDGSFVTDSDGEYVINESTSSDNLYKIRNYRPRIESLFARIERWTEIANGRISWRLINRDNICTLFGWTEQAVIANPANPLQIFEWLPEFVFDDKGHCFRYIYKKDDIVGFDSSFLHNNNRLTNGQINYTNTYLEKVLYGNNTPYQGFGNDFPAESDFLFSTVLDYGEYNANSPFDKNSQWDFRADAFSSYKSGFEIRTTRLCKRVLLFHHFLGQNEYDGLVKSIDFEYDTSSEQDFTFLKSITKIGYIKKADGTYTQKNLPPMEFEYQKHDWNKEIKELPSESLINAPVGINDGQYLFTDLFNEGLSGILSEQGNGWYYKQNLGSGEFSQATLISPKPSFNGLGKSWQLTDLDADGGKQLTNYNSEPRGYFELNDSNEWSGLRNFKLLPNVNFKSSDSRMIDLNGDGKAELVISDEQAFVWYPSNGREGFSASIKTPKPFDEESGAHLVFSDSEQTIFLADMSGDGLTDIVRIRNGEVCYWANLGYGKFGKKILFDNSPVFDHPDSFNPKYIRLADIDGSGTTDIIYLGKNKFSCWKNLSGNSFHPQPFEIEPMPEIHSHSKISVLDLLGNGVACIVWSSDLTKDANKSLKYIDLMNSKKPHLLVSYKNNFGKELTLEYKASTHFYLEDKKSGKPWVTKLHFPMHCIAKTTSEDKISGYKFISEYKYHHGYYDHPEREFRGFGMVEQIDAESFEHWEKGNASNVVEDNLHQEPIVSKMWNHTGAFLQNSKILNQFAEDYWYKEMERQGFAVINNEKNLPDARIATALGIDANLLDILSVQELREAYRACKGMTLRTETFANDAAKYGNTDIARMRELTPFNVATHNCVIELLQPKGKNKHAVFFVRESEAITYNYERNPEDPRISHTLNIKADEYGNVLESASLVYPRLIPDISLPAETQAEQSKTLIIYTDNKYTNDIIANDIYRLRLKSDVKSYELKGVNKTDIYYSIDDFDGILSDAKSDTAMYHEINKPLTVGKAQRRLIEHIRTLYYRNNLNSALPLGQLESLALPFESYQLAFTPELVTHIFGAKVNSALLIEGKYTHTEGDNNWWIRSGTTQYKSIAENQNDAKNRFYSPISYTDPNGAITKVQYYGSYFLFVESTEDAFGNEVIVEKLNFRTLEPTRMKDINGNLSELISNELGFVKAIAVMGKGNEADELKGFAENTEAAELTAIDDYFNSSNSIELTTRAKNLLNRASIRFIYNLDAFIAEGKPVVVSSITREQHFQKLADSPVQIAFEYSNGMGDVIMKKVQAEPGIAKQVTVNPDDTILVNEIDSSILAPPQLRWLGNGRTIKNNKGNPVKQYEPYFSINWKYEDYKELVESGVTPKMYYDAAGRLLKTELPDGTFSKVEFDSWKQLLYDANDTILESTWYINRSNRLIDAELIAEGKDPGREKIAADKATKHADTPIAMHADTLGRPILTIEHNKNLSTDADEFYDTSVKLDIEGNLRELTDARGNSVMQYEYDMLGNIVYQNSMDAGIRWTLTNIFGKPLRTWDERNHEFQFNYDILQRPTITKVLGGDGTSPLDNIFDLKIYGESQLLPNRTNEAAIQAKNILGQLIQYYDTGGLLDTPDYDFKGQAIATNRKLFRKYKELANWINANLISDLESGDGFTFSTETDALGRITQQIAPDGSLITPSYNETGLFNGESVLHSGEVIAKTYIKDIDYNEKGHRLKITYGNDVFTKFYYDKKTFRVKRLETKRQNNDPLQDWYYTYDAVGNVTHIEDKNIPEFFFDNQKITGISTYTYDALYRLAEATGRENNSTHTFDSRDNYHDLDYIHELNPGDPMSVRNYTQNYTYDAVGNILQMRHQSAGNNWTRNYAYQNTNNRIISTQIGSQTYLYPHHPKHGYITQMPHLEEMGWNFKEELVRTIRQSINPENGTPATTYYQYDGNGKRIRKITENSALPGVTPTRKDERIYIAGYELYKKHSGLNSGLERTSLSLMDEGHRFVMVETRNDINDGTEKQLIRYQLHNHLGSCALELDDTAQVISYEEYHPYGTTAFQARNSAIKSASKRYRHTGMERDEETGLSYHSARYYVTWLGRWLNTDPIGIGDGVNMYQYCRGNPIKMIDTSGEQALYPVFNTGDPSDPLNYVDYESFRRGAILPLRESGYRGLWNSSHPGNRVPNPTIYQINPSTGRAETISLEDARTRLGWSESRFERSIRRSEVFILRNGNLSITNANTVGQINNPSTATPLMEFAIRRLQADAARYGGGNFPSNYYVTFSRAVIQESIRLNGPDSGMDAVHGAFGSEDFSQGRAVLHLYEALARSGEHTGFDKVQHFVASAYHAYGAADNLTFGLTTDVLQYGKEIFYDEIPSWFGDDIGYDPYDMLANNRGQAYGQALYDRYHPLRNPVTTTTRVVKEEVTRQLNTLERFIYWQAGVPRF